MHTYENTRITELVHGHTTSYRTTTELAMVKVITELAMVKVITELVHGHTTS